jgi:dolichol-phosphate mannosyltransferase
MLSVIAPTYNEASNIEKLVKRIFAVLDGAGIAGEVIIVDDNSPDGTGDVADRMSGEFNLRVIHRRGRRGLASAVLEGFSAAKGELLCVIDADLSHPPEAIPKMYKAIEGRAADFVIGSRLVPGGGSTDWSGWRSVISLLARLLARPITDVSDSTSGYFMIRREVVERVKLNPIGFKICLEIIAKGNYNRIEEIPITFAGRSGRGSKLGPRQIIEYVIHVLSLYGFLLRKKITRKGRGI